MTRPERKGTTVTQQAVTVLIADDQAVVRDGLSMVLRHLPEVEVVGTALDGEDAVRQVARLDPDIVLMDLEMPKCSGVEATQRLVASGARARVVVLTTYSDDSSVFAALRAGARGYLTKDADTEEIRAAISSVSKGEAQLDPSVQRRLLDALSSGTGLDPDGPDQPTGLPDGLTAREVEVLAHIAAGLSNSEIADALFLSLATVKTHINHILAKTSARTRAGLVRYAYRHGISKP